MIKTKESFIEYEEKILEIPIEKIHPNPLNPRERFVESEEDELIESIITKGIIKPLTVFKDKRKGHYIILDGERRYKVCKKLNIPSIPAFVLIHEPTTLENLSLMFHIHNVREEWTEFAVSLTIKKIVEELGKDVRNLTNPDIKEISKLTSLSNYKVKKYLTFLDYPNEVINIFFESEKKEKPDKGVDPDILSEMNRPIKEIKSQMPEILQDYPVEKIINACIRKKAIGIISTNKDFRYLSKTLTASKKGEIRKEVVKDKINEFLRNEQVTPKEIYDQTAETIYQVKLIIKNSNKLYDEINNLNLNKMTQDEKEKLLQQLKKLMMLIQQKFKID